MALLLGPPSSGKTTLLLALAGKLASELKVRETNFIHLTKSLIIVLWKNLLYGKQYILQFSGRVTYNGHGMNEFVSRKTAAYISQHDVHIGEMTVRETLAFSARCQGVGTRFGSFISRFFVSFLDFIYYKKRLGVNLECDFWKFADMLAELSRREKEANIKPDPDIDVYMKVSEMPVFVKKSIEYKSF